MKMRVLGHSETRCGPRSVGYILAISRSDLLIGLTLEMLLSFATWRPGCRGKELGEARVPSDHSTGESRVCSSHIRTRCRCPDRRTRTSHRVRCVRMLYRRNRTCTLERV